MHREWITYVIELPVVMSTEPHVRIESGAAAPRIRAFSDETVSLDQSSVSNHKA